MQSENQVVLLPLLQEKKVHLSIKREDLLHPFISGNKFRKLKYNLKEATANHFKTVLTFGGAFSNHIAATAYAARIRGFKSIGIIRGDELEHTWQENATLHFAYSNGMHFKFVGRTKYREKDSLAYIHSLTDEFGEFYLIPEGGTNDLAIKGCQEILGESDFDYNLICSCVGTGGTIAGLINSSQENQQILGFSALKGDFLEATVKGMTTKSNWTMNTDYHFGGYGKVNEDLVNFINWFKITTGIPLDPIYTGKMLFGLLDLIKRDTFVPGTRILAIHTGGLQGISGMNSLLKKKKLPLLEL